MVSEVRICGGGGFEMGWMRRCCVKHPNHTQSEYEQRRRTNNSTAMLLGEYAAYADAADAE